MAYLVGTDEAGYGPNLGPLVVTATLWHVDERRAASPSAGESLYERLAEVVTAERRDAADPRLWIADSKAIYSTATGLELLERNVLPMLCVGGRRPTTFRELMSNVATPIDDDEWQRPWHQRASGTVPLYADAAACDAAAERLAVGLAAAGVRLCAVRSCCLFPAAFNAGVVSCGNKANLLTQTTLSLVREMFERIASDDHASSDDRDAVAVYCDKHGGRNAYAPALQEHLIDGLVQVVVESRAASRYRFVRDGRSCEIGFYMRGESQPAAALASMVSKYLREAAMHVWNAYWCDEIADLKPTAGYPEDARRFREKILAATRKLNLDEAAWWRIR